MFNYNIFIFYSTKGIVAFIVVRCLFSKSVLVYLFTFFLLNSQLDIEKLLKQ